VRSTGSTAEAITVSAELDHLIKSLEDPSLYPVRPDRVEIVQTHASVVFIAGDLVYKVKKPVNLGFLDFSTLEKRQFFCRQEVILNSRFSHDIYLGVAPISYEDGSGFNFYGMGKEVDAAVVMRRIPEDRFMTAMLEKDLVTPAILDRLADRLAYFHSQARRGPEISAFGAVEVIHGNLKENFDQTAGYVNRTLDKETYEDISAASVDFLFLREALFHDRVRGGFIRDCHGDLHLDHVLILDGIMFCDCIEFNDRFRYGDTASDLGFLLMDLDFQGFPAYAQRITQRYAQYSGDRDIVSLLAFYKSYRAFVRGKVLSFALDEPEISAVAKSALSREAQEHFAFARAYFHAPPPPTLVILTGLIATGKSSLARQLGKRLGIDPFGSDTIRKGIHHIPPFEHHLDKFESGVYTPSATELTYAALLDRARQALDRGESVVLDASFMRYRDRQAAGELARASAARLRIIECTAPDHIIQSRLEKRQLRQDEPSDGRWEIYCEQKTRFEPIRPDEHPYHRVWDSTTDLNTFLRAFVREIMCSSSDRTSFQASF
jgi:uncharacterized protein